MPKNAISAVIHTSSHLDTSVSQRSAAWAGNVADFRGCFVVYYESIKRELKTKPIYECRCDERLKTKPEESTSLVYTGLLGELEHLKIETNTLCVYRRLFIMNR